ncbi:MAG TPA: hypothetical protein VMH34_00210, partial [Gammaproteobacteria bacterium]|nr:hypothetical protein [Gammaproteobacteria bacterium]
DGCSSSGCGTAQDINTITADNFTNTWTITGANKGTLTNADGTDLGGGVLQGTLSGGFRNIDSLTGGTGDDTFVFQNNGSLNRPGGGGGIDGGGAATQDTIDISAISGKANTVDLTAGTISGVNGSSVTVLGGTFTNVTNFVGDNANDTLAVDSGTNTFTISGSNSGDVGGTVTFTGFPNLTGGSGNDTFAFTGAGSVDGDVEGEGGSNTLDYSGYGSTITVTLTGPGSTSNANFAGTASGIGGSFDDISVLVGTNTGDTLIGDDNDSTWTINGSDAGTVTDGTSTMKYSQIANLTGGSGDDSFVFTAAGSVSGTIDGGSQSTVDSVDYSALATVTVDLAGGLSGAINIEQLIGGDSAGTTNFTLIDGNNWSITSHNSGTVDGIIFTNWGNLTGTTGNDTFAFGPSGDLSGKIDGAAGTDSLDYSGYGSAVTVTLTNNGTTDGYQGTATAITGGFDNIDDLVGSGNAGDKLIGAGGAETFTLTGTDAGNVFNGTNTLTFSQIANLDGGGGGDTLQGDDVANTWKISGADTGSVTELSGTFKNFANLTGGSDDDSFQFTGGNVTGAIDGGTGGTDTLDYSGNGGVAVTVTLAGPGSFHGFTGTASSVGTTFDDIDNLVGSSKNDTLIGTNNNDTWSITGADKGDVNGFTFSSIENLTGGTGNDTFQFFAGGTITGNVDGGGGTDTADYSNDPSARTVSITSVLNMEDFIGNNSNQTLLGSNTTNTWTIDNSNSGTFFDGTNTSTFSGFPNLTGGTANDTFNVINFGSVTGVLNGGTGTNNLDLTGVTYFPFVYLGTPGIGSDVAAVNMTTITGPGNAVLFGANINNTWNVNNGSGNVTDGDGVGTVNFSGFNNLVGGNQIDTFNASGTNNLSLFAYNVLGPTSTTTNTFNISGTLNGNIQGDDGADTYNLNGTVFNIDTGAGDDVLVPGIAQPVLGSITSSGQTDHTASLTIPGTPGADLNIGVTLILPDMTNYTGSLVIGGTVAPTAILPLTDNSKVTVNTNILTVTQDVVVGEGGSVMLLGNDVQLAGGDVVAGTAGGSGQIIIAAVGDSPLGTITATAPTTLTAGNLLLIANNNLQGSENISLNLNNGGIALFQGDTSAGDPAFAVTDASAIDEGSFQGIFGFDPNNIGNVFGVNLQFQELTFSNPGAALSANAVLQYLDTGLFETELTLFGVVGNGIAMDISQCEDLEGCAPSVTMEQLNELISGLETRIGDLVKSKEGGKVEPAKVDTLIAGFQKELENFRSYRTELEAYQKEQQEAEESPENLEDLGGGGEEELGPSKEEEKAAPAGKPAPAGGGKAKPSPEEEEPGIEEEAPAPKAAPKAEPKVAPKAAPKVTPPKSLEENLDIEEQVPEKPGKSEAKPEAKPAPKAAPKTAPKLEEHLEEEEIIDQQSALQLPLIPASVSSYQWFDVRAGNRLTWAGDITLPHRYRNY